MNQDQQPRSWRKRAKDNWTVLALVPLVVIIAIVVGLGYLLSWEWTGLVGISENPKTRTVWDWLELLIIPLVLALGGFWFNQRARKGEQEQRQNELKIADEQRKEDALQRYLDRMSELILDKQLRDSKRDDAVRAAARARTLTVLRMLDGDRKGQVVRFLHEADLIGTVVREESGKERVVDAVIDLQTADLSGANLGGANLSGADLSGANLGGANLSGANLIDADLGGAFLIGADLGGAFLSRAHLSRAHLSGADLSGADLSNAYLEGAILLGADLIDADLSDAHLSGAVLWNADLSGAVLWNADLSSADLREAKEWTNEQLAQAESLVRATLPDGTIMTEEAREEFKKRYGQSS